MNIEERKRVYTKIVGDGLKREREICNLSQQEVANIMGYTRAAISAYERGIRSINTDELLILCNKCGFNFSRIVNPAIKASDDELNKILYSEE